VSAPAREDCPALAHLLEAYFHQDWPCDHSDQAAVLREIVAREPPDRLRAAADELTALLARRPSEQELASFLYGVLYVDYLPPADGLSYAQWLEQVRATFGAVRRN
jgi:CdiI immunity protein